MTSRFSEKERYPLGRWMDYAPLKTVYDKWIASIATVREVERRYGLRMWDESPNVPQDYRDAIAEYKRLREIQETAWRDYDRESIRLMGEPIRAVLAEYGGSMSMTELGLAYRPVYEHGWNSRSVADLLAVIPGIRVISVRHGRRVELA